MARDDVELLRELYATWNELGPEGIAERFWADDVEWHDVQRGPDPGTYRGRRAAQGRLEEFVSLLGHFRFEVDELTGLGDEVLAVLRVHGDASASGLPFDGLLAQLGRVEGGKVVRVRNFLSRDDAVRAARAEG